MARTSAEIFLQACLDKNIPLIHELVAVGVYINYNFYHGTALHRLLSFKDPEYIPVVMALINLGAIVDTINLETKPIHKATWSIPLMQLLIEASATERSEGASADVNALDDQLRSPLHLAIITRAPIENIRFLLDAGADIFQTGANGYKAVHHASASNRLEIIETLAAYGADFNAKTYSGITPLHVAIGYRKEETINFLVKDLGVDTSIGNIKGSSIDTYIDAYIDDIGKRNRIKKLLECVRAN